MNFLRIPAVLALLAPAAAACSDATTTSAGDDGGTAAGPDGSTGATDGGAATDAGSTSASLTWTAGTITGADAEKVCAFHAMAFGAGRFVACRLRRRAHAGGRQQGLRAHEHRWQRNSGLDQAFREQEAASSPLKKRLRAHVTSSVMG